MNLKTYVNLFVGYQIIFVTSALIYLTSAEKYTITTTEIHRVKGKKTRQEMTYARTDFKFAVFLLICDLALYFSLFILIQVKGWWNLQQTLNQKLSNYPVKIYTLMIEKFRNF